MKIKCAFCKSSGIDPFQLMSKESFCQVCGGKGEVQIEEPCIECVFCNGTGVHPGTRLTCTVCGGKGMFTVKEKSSKTCSKCNGAGSAVYNSSLTCSACRGKGIIYR